MDAVMTQLAKGNEVRVFVMALIAIAMMNLQPVLLGSGRTARYAFVAISASYLLALTLAVFRGIRRNSAFPHKMLGTFLDQCHRGALTATEVSLHRCGWPFPYGGTAAIARQRNAISRRTANLWMMLLEFRFALSRAERPGVFGYLRVFSCECFRALEARYLSHVSLYFETLIGGVLNSHLLVLFPREMVSLR